MDAWFLNHVLGLSVCLSVLLLALPGPLGAGTPGSNSTDPVTAGMHYSSGKDELGRTESGAASTSYSSRSSSPSHRNLPLTRAAAGTRTAASTDTEQTQAFTETSSTTLETANLSTEPLASTLVVATTEATSSSSGSSSSSSSIINSSSSSGSSSSSSSIINSSSSIISSSSSSIISSSSSSGSSSSSSSSIINSSSSSSGSSSSIGSSSSTSSGSSSSSSSSGDWKDFTSTEHMLTSSREEQDPRLPQDSPSTTHRLEDSTSLSSQAAVLTDRSYTSTTISRAGERTLLSVTSSSSNITSSAFTEDSNSQQPSSTWDIPPAETETENYTQSSPSIGTDNRNTTNQQMTHSIKDTSETHSLTGRPNATQHETSSASEEPSDSTPPLRVTAPSTDQSEVPASSTPPITSPAGGTANVSESDPDLGSSAESSTASHSASTRNQGGTERLSSQTREESMSVGLTTVSPAVGSSTSGMSSSTDVPVLVTNTYLTTPGNITDRPRMTDEDTASTPTATTATPSLPSTSSFEVSSAASSSAPPSPTEATIPHTTPSTTAQPTVALQTSTGSTTPSPLPSQTQGPSTGTASPTDAATLQTETSTGIVEVTTVHGHYISTTYTHSPPARTTEAVHTTGKQTDRATTHLLMTTSPADMQTTKAPPLTTNPCVSNPCMNGGVCHYNHTANQFSCKCQQAWTGLTCNQDIDECEEEPCPAGSKCVNTRGSFSCECPLGFDLEDGRTCTRAKTFLGTFGISQDSANMHEIQREIIQLLNASLSVLRGYRRSTLSKKDTNGLHILAVNMFSISTNVSRADVYSSIIMSLSNCSSSLAHCRKVLNSLTLPSYLHNLTYQEESLCEARETQCDKERSSCADNSGTAYCQCHEGYYKHNPDDLSCLECGDGYKLENGTCVMCMFGFGGFNCGNFYKLIAVVVAPSGGALLLILIIALAVTCCRKNKNDINKIIFKSGDLQMSPYADFPKNNRISMEWGRETIEMQENGSTKNLLQMTDIYYSPALRNSDLDRNGLYPFMGLPGSRHSCIYPAQWNPSFISDDSRRRDYF